MTTSTTATMRAGLLTAALLLAGCASTGGPPQKASAESAGESTGTGTAPEDGRAGGEDADVPEDVSDALLPPVRLGGSGQQRRELRRFDVDVDDVPARTFFMSLVQDTPFNVVVHPDVSGRVSLTLKDVTIPQVLQTVQEVYGYEVSTTAAGYRVMPADLQTRVFSVAYLSFKRQGRSRTRVTSGQVTEVVGGEDDRNRSASRTTQDDRDSESRSLAGSKIETRTESNLWTELEKTVRTLVGTGEGRKVVVSPESGLVVVRAMPNELREVEDLLRRMQGSLTRQVILEAKILEVELNDRFEAGVNWAALDQDGGDTIFAGQVGGRNVFEDGRGATAGTPLNISPGNPITGFNSSALGGTFALAADISDFNAVIELLQTQGDVHVLSSPRVSTVNNQKAIIKVGTDEFFVTGVESNTTTGNAVTQSQEIELTPFFSGIALDVTPQISKEGDVILHVHPTVSEVRDQTKQITAGGQAQSLPLALSDIRESDSIVRAEDGQVVVIGGLMEDTVDQTVVKTPILGDIPLLGNLFRQKRTIKRKSELVILLKPIVANGPGAWQDQIRRSRERVRELRPGLSWPGDGGYISD